MGDRQFASLVILILLILLVGCENSPTESIEDTHQNDTTIYIQEIDISECELLNGQWWIVPLIYRTVLKIQSYSEGGWETIYYFKPTGWCDLEEAYWYQDNNAVYIKYILYRVNWKFRILYLDCKVKEGD